MKRPVLSICSSCSSDEAWDGESFFAAVKAERKARGLKPLLKLRDESCLGGCDTPCNAELKAKGRPRLRLTWLHGVDDVNALLDGATAYAGGDDNPKLPGRPAPRER